MQAEDNGELDYAPPEDERRIWSGLSYLNGIDMRNETCSYLHSIEDIRDAYERLRDDRAA